MGYPLAIGAVVTVHLAFLAYVVLGGFLTWRWPRSIVVHLPVALYGLLIITVGWTCPLTVLENRLRQGAGWPRYEDGFIDHYLTGRLYPADAKSAAELVAALLVGLAYLGWGWRQHRAQRGPLRRRASA
jgi:hypothetical protein